MYSKIHCIGRMQFLCISRWYHVNCALICVMSNYTISCLGYVTPMVSEWNTSMKHWWNDTNGGKRTYTKKNQAYCRFGQQKSHTDFFLRDWTWATVITDRRLTTWTMARPRNYGLRNGSVGYLPPFHHRGTGFDLTLVHMNWGVCGRLSDPKTDGSPNTSLLAGSIIPPMLYTNRSITSPTPCE